MRAQKETYDGKLVMEKDLNYRIATSLKSYLEQYDGIKLYLQEMKIRGLALFRGLIMLLQMKQIILYQSM